MEKLTSNYAANAAELDLLLGVGRSCDMVSRDYVIGGRRARLWVVDGFGSDSIIERMGAFWLTLKPEHVAGLTQMQEFLDRFITFSESNVTFDVSDAVTSVFLGKSLLIMEGLSGAALMDAKGYPSRGVDEPPDGKVLRGSHDGFVEAVVPNMALLRRRIRDPHLTMEGHKVGSRSHNDAVLCYLDDKVDQSLLRKLRGKLLGLDIRSLSMAQESLAEAIRPKQWYNPFPKVRYTERPDAAAASISAPSMEKELERLSGVFKDASFNTSIKNSTTKSWLKRLRDTGSGEERKSSHPGRRLGSLTIRYHAGVMNRDSRNTATRRTRR